MDSSGNSVTITCAGSDTLDGAATKALTTQYQYATVICTASNAWSLFLIRGKYGFTDVGKRC